MADEHTEGKYRTDRQPDATQRKDRKDRKDITEQTE
jgi:hypothetical protein